MLFISSVAVGVELSVAILTASLHESGVERVSVLTKPVCKGDKDYESNIRYSVLAIVNERRGTLLSGWEINGPPYGSVHQELLPEGETMNEMEYSCSLERMAFALLDQSCSTNTPTAPNGMTALFYHSDAEGYFSLMSAVLDWDSQIMRFAISDEAITDEQVVYKNKDHNLWEYLNLMRDTTSEMGCGEITCRDGDLRKYRAVCLLNNSPLTDGDVIYKLGDGGCNRNGICRKGGVCDWADFCD